VTDGVEVRRRLREFGRQFTPEMIQGTHQFYVASQRARDYLAPAIERDITYGAHLRNRLIPPMVWAPGHNHVSYVLGLGVDDDSVLDDAVRRFIADIMNA
jgi:hypothetical protein